MIGVVTPQRLSQIITEVARAESDRYTAAVKDAFEQGWLIWSIQPPRKRYQGYKNSTLQADFLYLMDTDYLELYKAEVLPPLQVLTEWQALSAQGIQPQSYQRYFWALLMPPLFPDFIFRSAQKDFISLVRQELASGE